MNTMFNISLEAEKGTTIKVVQEERELRIIAKPLSIATYGDYEHPVIPKQYAYVTGEWDNGFVIEDLDSNQFVWIPVGYLTADGTLDGENFCEKFGRRNYQYREFSKSEYHEDMDGDLRRQFESVQKYGGFYIGRYAVSQVNGKIRSVKDEIPMTKVNFDVALEEARKLDTGDDVTSHLVYGAEYDSMREWFLATGKTQEEITKNSTGQEVVRTGSREEWKINNIYDIVGNNWEWTQEAYDSWAHTIRGGSCFTRGDDRRYLYYTSCYGYDIGFRVALYIP